MEHTRKMVLVPQNMMQSFHSHPSTIGEQQVSALDTQIKTILERTDLSEYAKAQLYSQYLHRYLSRECFFILLP